MGIEGFKRTIVAVATAATLSGPETAASAQSGCVVRSDRTTTQIPSECFESIDELLDGEVYRVELLENLLAQIVPADRLNTTSLSVQNTTGNFLLVDQGTDQPVSVSVGIYDSERSGYEVSVLSTQDLAISRDAQVTSINGLAWGASTPAFALSFTYNIDGSTRSGAAVVRVDGLNAFIQLPDVADGNDVTGVSCIPEVRNGRGLDMFYFSFTTPDGDIYTFPFESSSGLPDNSPEGARI